MQTDILNVDQEDYKKNIGNTQFSNARKIINIKWKAVTE